MIGQLKYSLILFFLYVPFLFSQSIKTIEITGDFQFDESDYLKWAQISVNQNSYPGIIDSAKTRINENLRLNGFHFSSFSEAKIDTIDSASVALSLTIEEGNPTEIRKVYFSTNDSFAIQLLDRSFAFLEGQIFNKAEIEESINNVLVELEETGFPFSKVIIESVQLFKDSLASSNHADLYLKIDKGELSSIDKIEIRGNTSTNDDVIIRELRIEPGETYSQSRIEEFPKRLNRLRFFDPVESPLFYINSKNEGVLVITVKEKETNNFDGIIGYIPGRREGETGYITGLVNISLRNLFGTGRAAALRWNKFDRESQELELKYLEPWFLNYPFNINLGLYQRIQDTTYVQRKFDASIEYLATEDISASLLVGTESVIPSVRTIPVFTVFNSSIITTGASLKIDTRDDAYAPTEGLVFINSYSFSRKTIDGPTEYITPTTQTKIDLQRISFDFDFFYQIFFRQVIAFSISGRELRGPSFENSDLFRLGGTNTLRGYREEQFLGSRLLWSNLEYRFLLTRRSFAFIFFDNGYYLRNPEPDRNIPKQEEFKYGYGVGLNLETALGVLGVSFALGEGDSFSDGKIHFGIINEF